MKQLLLFIICFGTGRAQCQVSLRNGSFENWHLVTGHFFAYDPDYWTSSNRYSGFTNNYVLDRSSDAHSGMWAAKLTPLQSPNAATRTKAALCLGYAPVDSITYDVNYFFAGDSIQHQPIAIQGYYKYVPDAATGDSAYVIAYLKKANTIDPWMDAVVSVGSFVFIPNFSTSYSLFNLPFANVNPGLADSIVLCFYYSSKNTSSTPNGYLLLDDINTITSATSVTILRKDDFKIYPNPTNTIIEIKTAGNIIISTIELIDSNGRKIKRQVSNKHTLNVEGIPSGSYIITIHTNKGVINENIILK